MKIMLSWTVFIIILCAGTAHAAAGKNWIRVNQLGYLPGYPKVAVFVSKENTRIDSYEIRDVITDEVKYRSNGVKPYGPYAAFTNGSRLIFPHSPKGAFYIRAERPGPPDFRISGDVLLTARRLSLRYVRQQRCGFNPCLNDSCHTVTGSSSTTHAFKHSYRRGRRMA